MIKKLIQKIISGKLNKSTTSSKSTIGLLIIDHGSKYEAANLSLSDVADLVRVERSDLIVEIAHMELAKPTIKDGFNNCVSKGATHIIAHPYMLSLGRHAVNDIPNLVKEASLSFPNVTYEVTLPLGPHKKISSVILERCGLLS